MIYQVDARVFCKCVDRANLAAAAAEATRDLALGRLPQAMELGVESPEAAQSMLEPADGAGDRFAHTLCAICMQPVGMPMLSTGDDAPLLTVCRHVFHRGCICTLQATQDLLQMNCPKCMPYIGPMDDRLAPRDEDDFDTSTMAKALQVCKERLSAALGCIYQARLSAIGGDTSVESECKFITTVQRRATSATHRAVYDSLMHDACKSCVGAYEPGDAHDAFDLLQDVRMGRRADLTPQERARVTEKISSAIVRNQSSLAVLVLFVLMLDPETPMGTTSEDFDNNPWKPFVTQWRDAAIRNSMSFLDRAR